MLLNQLEILSNDAADRIAVVSSNQRLTYAELREGARRVAHSLRARDVSRGSVVAVYTARSTAALTAMLGVMMAGAAYTVVEDEGERSPSRARLQAIAPALTLCSDAEVPVLGELGLRALSLDVALRGEDSIALPRVLPSDLAYVLYTSGSTGRPKGVAVAHGNVAHYTTAIRDRLQIEPGLTYAHVSTLAADLGNTSLFLSLYTGGALHIVSGETRKDPAALRRYLIEHRIEFLKITPSHWGAVFNSFDERTCEQLRLKFLLLGGEALPVSLARKIIQSGAVERLVNHYGPTETTVGVTAYPIARLAQLDELPTESVPIGVPLGSTILRVRSEDGTFHERNARGELYIGGPSVAHGYVGDPVSTDRAFVSINLRSDA